MNLQTTNIIACIFHFICFSVVLILYLVYKNSRASHTVNLYRNQLAGPINNTSLPPISPNTLSYCSTGGLHGQVPGTCTITGSFQQPLKVSKVNVIVYCMVFFIITAIFHALYAWDVYIPMLSQNGQGFYTSVIQDGWNPYRWVEYATSASLMSVILGVVQGTGDVVSILFMGGVTAAMQFFGFSVENVMRKSIVDDLGYVQQVSILGATFGGWLLFAILWISNLYCFVTIVNDTHSKFKNVIDPQTNKNIKTPAFVYFILITKIISYASFGVIQLYQIYQNWNALNSFELINFEKIENLYLILSFLSKFGLAGGVSYGLLLSTKDCE